MTPIKSSRSVSKYSYKPNDHNLFNSPSVKTLKLDPLPSDGKKLKRSGSSKQINESMKIIGSSVNYGQPYSDKTTKNLDLTTRINTELNGKFTYNYLKIKNNGQNSKAIYTALDFSTRDPPQQRYLIFY
jgi:hypothetical protein